MAGEEGQSLAYWLRWQVLVCALIAALPAAAAVWLIKKKERQNLRAMNLWVPYWRNVSPFWLLAYRGIVFLLMAWLLVMLVLIEGVSVFYFYTQWTFALVLIYFLLGTMESARGCWIYSRQSVITREQALLQGNLERGHAATSSHMGDKIMDDTTLLGNSDGQVYERLHGENAGFSGYVMHIVYQMSAGAVVLTDAVFWIILLPDISSMHHRLDLLMVCMHSLNAVFLLVDTMLNSLPIPWFGMTYFVLWSCTYVAFQWVLHACGSNWWPYPFMELSTPWAPLWYLAMALIHFPCFSIFYLFSKAKNMLITKFYPNLCLKLC
ncbi:hypothetical protein HPP92_001694 [Vanilla planifolia]|uniref:Uncharacterized protein n=1 Tax=Vanilla planifolia TaxID=51239 RepID=A0A835VJW9_VANPL|nr:hypothetical protein HPP92_001694 [Vanilla planifolia]